MLVAAAAAAAVTMIPSHALQAVLVLLGKVVAVQTQTAWQGSVATDLALVRCTVYPARFAQRNANCPVSAMVPSRLVH